MTESIKIKPIVIDLLRHGEVEGEHWAFRGSMDAALSAKGLQQMQAVGDALKDESFSAVATSPLQRCRLFSESLATNHDVPLQILQDMREFDFGDWEGKTAQDIDAEQLKQFWSSPVGFTPPNGEVFDDFAIRVIQGWETWLQDANGEHRLLVAHGGVMRVILTHILNMPLENIWRVHLPYASWCRVSLFKGEQPRLLFMNRESE